MNNETTTLTPEQQDYQNRAKQAQERLQVIFNELELSLRPEVEMVYGKQGISYKASVSWVDMKKPISPTAPTV